MRARRDAPNEQSMCARNVQQPPSIFSPESVIIGLGEILSRYNKTHSGLPEWVFFYWYWCSMGKGDKHSQKRDYMHKNYRGSKAERIAKEAKRRQHQKKEK